jgi:hypothetical protein
VARKIVSEWTTAHAEGIAILAMTPFLENFRIGDHTPRTREPWRAKHVMIVPSYSTLDDVRFGEWFILCQH